jgi:hypothetical protein
MHDEHDCVLWVHLQCLWRLWINRRSSSLPEFSDELVNAHYLKSTVLLGSILECGALLVFSGPL